MSCDAMFFASVLRLLRKKFGERDSIDADTISRMVTAAAELQAIYTSLPEMKQDGGSSCG